MSSRTIGFTSGDAARVRFARSCLWEVLASVRVLQEPANHSVHLPWVRRVTPRLRAGLVEAGAVDAFALLVDLVGSGVRGDYAPDLLTPPPTTLEPSLEHELAALKDTSSEVVREQLDHLRGRWTPRLQDMAEDPKPALAALTRVIGIYWEIALAPYWAPITAVADAEIFLRGQQQVTGGTAALLNDLHERVRWDGRSLIVSGTTCLGTHDLEGGGLCLVPSIFIWPAVLVVADGHTAQLAFPCRGIGTLWEGGLPNVDGLEGVMGRSKARLLAILQTPLSTSEAASRLELSISATSEHLSALRAAGLVHARRSGRIKLNVRTAVADAMIAAEDGQAGPRGL